MNKGEAWRVRDGSSRFFFASFVEVSLGLMKKIDLKKVIDEKGE